MLTNLVKMYQVVKVVKYNKLTVGTEYLVFFINTISDAANDYSDNMSEQVDVVEVKTEPNESDELVSICKITNVVANHSRNHKTTAERKIYI